jgi:uncharacterized protein (DUF2147 family)
MGPDDNGIESMRRIMPLFLFLASTTLPASAAEPPLGEWVVANGAARIKIDKCGDNLWGVISWEQRPGGRDGENPDPAKRNRPTLGMPILLHMKPTQAGRWEGEVYNAQNGKTYDSQISMAAPDKLRIEGCVLGFLCGGETWDRFKTAAVDTGSKGNAGLKTAPPESRGNAGMKRQPSGRQHDAAASGRGPAGAAGRPDDAVDVCMSVSQGRAASP